MNNVVRWCILTNIITAMTNEELRMICTEGRNLLETMKSQREPLAQTKIDYANKYRILVETSGEDGIWAAALETTKVSTFRARRAAIIYTSCQILQDNLRKIEKLAAALKSAESQIEKESLGSDMFKCAEEIAKANKILNTTPGSDQLTNRIRRKSKRNPGVVEENWREILADRMMKWRTPYLVSAVTGCRPVEMAREGVEFHIHGNDLVATIGGAKLTEYSGQPQRTLSWPLDHPAKLVSELVKIVQSNGGRFVVKMPGQSTRSEAIFSTAVRDAGKRAFPRLNSNITPYSLRHAFSSDLKAADFSKVEIAQALGHISTDTQNRYGHTNLARGVSLAPKQVSATREVCSGSQRPVPNFGNTKTESESMRG